MNKKQIIRLTESDLRDIVEESVNEVLNENFDTLISEGVNADEVVNTILNDQKLLEKAITSLSPRFVMFPKGSTEQQNKWRREEFIGQTPEIFKGIMSVPKRIEIVKRLYMELRQRYPQYF